MPLVVTGPPDEWGHIPGVNKVCPFIGHMFERYPAKREWSGWYGWKADGVYDPTFDLYALKKKQAEDRKADEVRRAEERRAREAAEAAAAAAAPISPGNPQSSSDSDSSLDLTDDNGDDQPWSQQHAP